jgi:Cytochrome P460
MILDVGDVSATRNKLGKPKPQAKQNDSASHENFKSYGVVYANKLASQAYTETKSQVFPVGSIIVREKLSRPDANQPDLLAVMIKREPGFNPAGGDWLFLTVDGAASKVIKRMKKGACLECHRSARERDFVFQSKRVSEVR